MRCVAHEDTHVEGERVRLADRPDLTVLEHAEKLRLAAAGGISPISSRKSVPPVAAWKRPCFFGGRAGERAASMAEELGLEELSRQCGDVHGDEGRIAPRTARVERARDDLLTGPALAEDHH